MNDCPRQNPAYRPAPALFFCSTHAKGRPAGGLRLCKLYCRPKPSVKLDKIIRGFLQGVAPPALQLGRQLRVMQTHAFHQRRSEERRVGTECRTRWWAHGVIEMITSDEGAR